MSLISPAQPPWDLTRIVLAVTAIGGLVATSFWVLRPFLPAVVWATMIVIATWPTLRMVEARLGGKRGLAVAVMTLVMFLLVVAPIAVGILTVVDHADTIVAWSRALADFTMPGPPERVRRLPLVGEKIALEWQKVSSARPEDLALRVRPYLKDAALWILGQAGGLGALFIQLLLTVVVSGLLYARGETVAAGVRAFARRLAGEAGERVTILSAQAIRAVALGIVVTALVQAAIGGLGLALAGVPYAALLTAVMFLLGIAQIGPVPVLLGAVIWLYWREEAVWGTVLIVWSLATTSLDNFLRPFLIKRGADLPLLLIFGGVLGGILAFGIIGLFIGPVVLAVTYTLLQAWVNEEREAPQGGKPDALPSSIEAERRPAEEAPAMSATELSRRLDDEANATRSADDAKDGRESSDRRESAQLGQGKEGWSDHDSRASSDRLMIKPPASS